MSPFVLFNKTFHYTSAANINKFSLGGFFFVSHSEALNRFSRVMCFIIRTQTLQVPPYCLLSSDTVNLAIISSDNGLSTFQRQTIISTNAGLLHRCKQIYVRIGSKSNNCISRKCTGKWCPRIGGHLVSTSAWWCHHMETFPASLAICAGN